MARAAPVAVEEADVPAVEAPPPKAIHRKLMLVSAAALFVVGACGGAAWYLIGDLEDTETDAPVTKAAGTKAAAKSKAAPENMAQNRKPAVFMNLEAITVNLQAGSGDRYLQTTMVFELTDEKTAEAVKAQMPVIRSKLLLLLSSQNAAELIAPGGKEQLALEVVEEARRHFTSKPPEQALLNVHFNAFVIQ